MLKESDCIEKGTTVERIFARRMARMRELTESESRAIGGGETDLVGIWDPDHNFTGPNYSSE